MATQSPKTRKTKTTKKTTTTKAKTVAKKPVKTAAKTPNKSTAAAVAPKRSRVKFSRPSLRRNRAAAANAPKAPGRAVVTVASLFSWNKWMALLYLVQGALIILLSEAQSIPVVGQYLALDTLASQGQDQVRVPAQQHLFDVNIVYWLAGVSFVFALGHLLAATVLRRRYDAQIAAGVSKIRWAAYSVGYAGLIVLFALLVGLNDVATLALLATLVVVTGVLAIAAERNGYQTSGIIRGLAAAALLVVWGVIAYSLLNAWLYDGSIRGYEYAMLGIAFLLSLQLGRIFMNQQKASGKWTDYVFAERAYILWTFVLVVATTWQLFVGALEP